MTTKSVCMWTNCTVKSTIVKKQKTTYTWTRPEFLQPYTVYTVNSMGLSTLYTLNVALTCGRSHPSGPGLSSWKWRSGSPGPDLLRPGSGPFYLGGGRKNTKYRKHMKLKHLNQLHSHKQFEFMSQPRYVIQPLESGVQRVQF